MTDEPWPPTNVVRSHRPDGYDIFKPIWLKPSPPPAVVVEVKPALPTPSPKQFVAPHVMTRGKDHKRVGCERKVRFETEQSASQAITRIQSPMRSYECIYCDGWHLTSKV